MESLIVITSVFLLGFQAYTYDKHQAKLIKALQESEYRRTELLWALSDCQIDRKHH